MYYFDNAASTRPYDETAEYLKREMLEHFGNPSALHAFGSKAYEAVEYGKSELLKLYGFKNHDVVFTSGATEAANMAVIGTVTRAADLGNTHIITTVIEHPCVSQAAEYIESRGGKVTYLPVDSDGLIDLSELKNAITGKTKLVSIIWVNNENGVIQDIDSIIRIVKDANPSALVHLDATQGFGKIAGRLDKADMVTLSAHKFHGPKGIGALIYRKGITLEPISFGGGQQGGFRSGTVNSPMIGALGKTCELTDIKNTEAKLKVLRRHLVEKLTDAFGASCINENLERDIYSPHIISVSFPGVKGEVLVHMLEADEIYVSTSSACSSHKKTKTVLDALGLDKNRIEGTLRISMSDFNTNDEIDYLVGKLKDAVEKLYALKGNGRK